MRIGFGFDTHRLAEGYPLMLGGVRIPHSLGAAGHSDADVLIHAICDALLGAAALRDIGYHFPDTDSQYKGIDSTILLQKTIEKIKEAGFSISNIDSTVVLQAPKINPYIPEMTQVLARVTGLSESQISVKAKTSEKLGFIGREEGVSAYTVVLIS
ncbi:MAG: 2-C-methyl-D-erythritol 2,4-cyclodiphosphate synthase [Syntrophothermus sp.]